MKKLVFTMSIAVLAFGVQAAATYNYAYQMNVARYEKDTSPSTAHVNWYTCYGMTQATAKELLGESKTVSYTDVATWLGSNFAANSDLVASKAQALSGSGQYDDSFEQYYWEDDGKRDSTETKDAIGLCIFKDNAGNQAYIVIANANGSSGSFSFDNSNTEDWQSVPEPTSGLLAIFGCALLALRRKIIA